MSIFQFERKIVTAYDNQPSVYAGIYEGERAKIENNRKFGEISLELVNKNERKGYSLKVGNR